MRVLVTGGAGFIGSHVADRATEEGFEVAILDNFSSGKHENVPNIEKFYCDVRDREAVMNVIKDYAPQIVSHHAAQVSVPASLRDTLLDAHVNVVGSINVIDACVSAGVERLIFASTGGAIYGDIPHESQSVGANESALPDPRSPYGIHKLTVEKLLRVYQEKRGLNSTVLRYSNVYGPRQSAHGESGVVAHFLSQAHQGKPLTIFGRNVAGDEGCYRDYVYVGDVAYANVVAMSGAIPQRLLNVGSGVAVSTLELAGWVGSAMGVPVTCDLQAPREGDVGYSVLDIALSRRVLGHPTPLAVGLRQTATWWRLDRS